MGKKKFIDKKNSQKFHLLHRSQTDAAYAKEGVPSEFVLVPVNEEGAVILNSFDSQGQSGPSALDLKHRKDHINELGFVNDGYDYSKHLKEMGGGKFVSKDGSVREITVTYKNNIEIPNDALPSTEELQRDYEAITISHELMDPDLHAALFDGCDEEGEFEALDDDFVQQVMTEPETPDFDFDQHIANLIARSEQMLGINKPRGWEGDEAKNLRRKVNYEDEDEEDEVESWVDDGEDMYDEDDEEMFGKKSSFVPNKVLGRMEFTEDQLDKMLEDYEDDQIGELDEVPEDELRGAIDEEDPAIQAVLDEYVQSEMDKKYAVGIKLKKGNRSSVQQEGEEEREVDPHTAFEEQLLIQKQSEEELRELDRNQETVEDMLQSQEYLKEERVYEEWDCETIISTYSTLDNHPRLIKDPKTKFRPFHSLKKATRHHTNNDEESASVSIASSSTSQLRQPNGSKTDASITQSSSSTARASSSKIILTGKMNLPEGFSKYSQPKAKGRGGLSSIEEEQRRENKVEESETESDDSDSDDKEGYVEVDGDREMKQGGKKKETKEEKRLRKQAVKEERKQKRMNKKLLKTVFQKEGVKIIKELGKEDSTNHVSVFKYSV